MIQNRKTYVKPLCEEAAVGAHLLNSWGDNEGFVKASRSANSVPASWAEAKKRQTFDDEDKKGSLWGEARQWVWWLVLVLSMSVNTAFADKIKDSSNFKVTEHNGYVTFEIMLMDGNWSDTWCRVGSVHAYSGSGGTGTDLHIMDVETNHDDDDRTNWEFFARNTTDGSIAFLANPVASGAIIEIRPAAWEDWKDGNDDNNRNARPSSVRYTCEKSSGNLCPTAKIDFYYPPEMAGKKWYFYYEYIHNKGSFHKMEMGGATCSANFVDLNFDASAFDIQRNGPEKLKVTLPQVTKTVESKLQSNRQYECKYKLLFEFVTQENKTVSVTQEYECDRNQKKTYDVEIPENVGNFKSVTCHESYTYGLKCTNGKFFGNPYKHTSTRQNLFPSVPMPFGLNTEYNQYENRADLVWNAFPTGSTNIIRDCTPYIYRVETNQNGEPLSGQSWSKRGTLDPVGDTQDEGYTDKMVQANTHYKYMVLNVPQEWLDNNTVKSSDLNSPSEKLIHQLGYCYSDVMGTVPEMKYYQLQQDTVVKDKVRLTWGYSRIPVSAQNVKFEVLRRLKGENSWTNYGNVTAPSNPAADYKAEFFDSKLPSNRETFEYKIRLTINNEKNTFESDIVTAGLLTGSAVTEVSATKGTHENVVRVSWKAKQVGSDNSNFEVSRRYAGTTDAFLKVYSVSGTRDSYTYEDNTVQPGYYYEYKVDVYNGQKDAYTDNNFQNALSDVGFCQARGVVSGRITFGSGSAVENVRLSIRSSADADGNIVRGYSQRVSGASAGIRWEADSAAISKLFAKDKDYTVQMFVRPDEDSKEEAVIAEIPTIGRLRLGSRQADGYKLVLEKYGTENVEKALYTNRLNIRAVIGDLTVADNASPVEDETYGTLYSYKQAVAHMKQWRDQEGYDAHLITLSTQQGSKVLGFGTKHIPLDLNGNIEERTMTSTLYDTGLILPCNTYSMLTFQNKNGEQLLIVDGDTLTSLTELSTKNYKHANNSLEDIPGAEYYHIGKKDFLISSEGTLSTYGVNYLKNNYMGSWTANGTLVNSTREVLNPFSVGGSEGITTDEAFIGNVTEVRVWDHALTQKEQTNVGDRMLGGIEKGLALYWPMDEGMSHYVFDASYTNDVPNGRHAVVGNNITSSTIIPTDAQLSRYGMTNDQGEYTIRSIPFIGNGTTYTVTPSKGIHVFSPTSRNGFIGSGSMALNNYDFTDQSSFKLHGKVTYLNTNIPSDSIQFKIDGDIVQSKDKMICSDSNGEYEISVPIGEHLIECYRDGHRLSSFPLDGSKYDFKQDETANFIDSTLVNVTGRVNGGFTDQNEPLGFKRSQNRLGKATIKLSLGKESQCSFNYITNDRGESSFGTTNLPVASATEDIQSTSYRAGGEHDDTYYIYITTDPETGEFSAMLPPLRYKVESIKFVGGTDYDDKPVFAQNLPFLDATNANDKAMPMDTLTAKTGERQEYKYSVKQLFHYRANPTITVSQVGMKNGAFGELKVAVVNNTVNRDSVEVLKFTDKGYQYVYGHPIFVQGHQYEYNIDVCEKYKNLDTGEEVTEVPADAVVTIINDASGMTQVYAENATVNGEEVKMGEPYETPNINVTPDKEGHVSYLFEGGWPNLAEGYLRNMSIGVKVDGRTTMWQAPDSKTTALDLVLLGSISSGTNFVTYGPESVDMILRRPPGSTSEATLTNKTITVTGTTVEYTKDGKSFNGGAHIQPTPTFSYSSGTFGPITVLADSKWKIVIESEHTGEGKWWDTEHTDNDTTYTLTNEIHGTTEGIQYHGDTYIGRSMNLLFGKGFNLGLYKQGDGTYKLMAEEGITVSEKFNTSFIYPQEYIEETLIPNWQAIIKARLTENPTVNGNHWELDEKAARVKGKVMYYTKYKPGDPEFGLSNSDKHWTKEQREAAKGYPSYIMFNGTDEKGAEDEVERAISQIQRWREMIALNEQDKLESFEDKDLFVKNYSIAGGTSVSETSTTEISTGTTWESHYEYTYNTENKFGAMLNDAGAYGIIGGTRFHGDVHGHKTGSGTEKTVAWTLSDGDPRTALSVDVFKSKRGWGPIFRTRGGQTANPYEGETLTQYYNGGGEKLDEATMRVEKPQLRVDGAAKLSNVPTGGEGKFNLELTNLSETNSACTYILEAIESSNKTGAILKMDGAVLSMGKVGRAVPMQAGEKINKMLYVSQSDRSITNFENLKLVLRSEKDDATHSDTISLSVEYVPASAIVEMSVDRTLINSDDSNAGGFKVTFTNLDRQDKDLQGVRLQSRRKGTNSWNLEYVWKTDAASVQQGSSSETLLPPTNTFDHAVKFAVDGTYELRGQTYGKYGGSEVTYETEIIEVVQDINGPKIVGMASHDGATLFYDDRNNMHLRFNEKMNVNAISKSDNITIEGGLNNRATTSQYMDVAVQLNGDPISTQATYNLNDNDYAFGMWFYRQGDGNIISLGTADNSIALYTHDGGKIAARVGDGNSKYETGVTLPADKWNYIAMAYKDGTEEQPQCRITLLYANSETDRPVYVGDGVPVQELEGQGTISIGGNGMKGMMHELTLWNIDKHAEELYETRDEQKAPYTPGLVGYWRMHEGHGTQLTDLARSRHMTMNTESWYINNRNLAARLEGKEPLKVDIASYNPHETDNFAMEMWFRADDIAENQNAQLLSNMNGMSIGFQEGNLVLDTSERTIGSDNVEKRDVKNTFVLSEEKYIDNEWHHVALNVRRGTSAVAYIDGKAVKTIPESLIPAPTGHYLYVGGEQTLLDSDGTNAGGAERLFQGDVDELRIWASALSSDLIEDRRYERMENGNFSLVGYFPMEDIHRDELQHVTTDFSMKNFGRKDSGLMLSGTTKASLNAPALLPGSSDMSLTEKDFDITASADEIYFSFKDHVLSQMDGNEFTVKVANIKDEHGNNSEPVAWKFLSNFGLVEWLGEINVEKMWNETVQAKASLYRKTATVQQNYEITGLPRWMEVDGAIGTMNQAVEEKTFTILPTVPVGSYTEYIYVTDRLGISRALKVNVKVKGDEPNWAVDPNLYESNMTLTGQVYCGDKICEYEDSKIAAFDDLGNCRGVGQPKYVSTRDAYYVDMIIYGASSTQLSSGQRKLTFKMYDASSGVVYPMVNVDVPGNATTDTIMYAPDANLGSYDTPVVFTATDNMQQTITLPRGWAWVSLYVQPKSTAINDVLPKSASEMKKYMNVKGKSAISTPGRDYKGFIGELDEIVPGNMYKIQVSTATKLNVLGAIINVHDTPYTIYPKWNWIGSLSNTILSVNDAFADLQPEKGDMVKTRTAMATYDGKGTWEGTLQNVVPGQGYIYFSQADHAKSFTYPNLQPNHAKAREAAMVKAAARPSFAPVHYEPVEEHFYPDNMNVIAVVKKDGEEVEDAEVAAFVNDECRGAVGCKSGYYFLNILGSAAEDINNYVELRVYLDGKEYTLDNMSFLSDAVLGTLDEPYVLDLDAIGGITIPSLATVKYATFYDSATAYKLPAGVTANVVTGMVNSKLVYETVAEGDKDNNVLPKNVAVMLTNSKSDTSPCTLIPTESSRTYTGDNWLHGSDEATTTTASGTNRFYKLTYGHSNTSQSDVFGWYWGAANGGAFLIEGHRAWLAVPVSAGVATRGFSVDGDATDIVDMEMLEDESGVYYDLQGRRVQQPLSQGVYIYKGKKIIVK